MVQFTYLPAGPPVDRLQNVEMFLIVDTDRADFFLFFFWSYILSLLTVSTIILGGRGGDSTRNLFVSFLLQANSSKAG